MKLLDQHGWRKGIEIWLFTTVLSKIISATKLIMKVSLTFVLFSLSNGAFGEIYIESLITKREMNLKLSKANTEL